MPQDIKIDVQSNLYDEIGKYLIERGVNKTIISDAYKKGMRRILTPGRQALKSNTVARTGWLRKSVGSKVDRFPDRLTVYGLVGYRNPGSSHQFWHVQGTKKRTTSSGANRGVSPPAVPNPIKQTEKDINSTAADILRETGKDIVQKAFKKADSKYSKKLAKL